MIIKITMRINRIYSQSAFTLIELLVVISIISTLSSVVMGSITLARDRANFIKFKSDLVQIRTAIVLYRESNGGAWPSAIGDGHNGSINALASQLHAAGMYHSNTFVIPRMILNGDISGGDNYG